MTSSSSTTQINFDESGLTAGTILTDQLDGIEVATSSEFGTMIFDTNSVTGEDFDLASTELNNVLIISEDGDSSDPDDDAAGGTINFYFDELVMVNSIGLLDIDEPGSSIAFYDENSDLLETIEIDSLGENSFQEINFDVEHVSSLEIDLTGSGAITGIDFATVSVEDPYSNIYVFGDSLVDTGNLFKVTNSLRDSSGLNIPILPPSPPYFEGNFSNGSIWIDNLAAELNISLTPATELSVIAPNSEINSPITIVDGAPVVSPFFAGNTTNQSVNFGYGLATSGTNGTGVIGAFVPGMERQVDFFIADHLLANQTADADALYILWVGSNDYFAGEADPQQVISNIEAQIGSLYDSGARDFLVVNLPDLGLVPEADNPNLTFSADELSELSETHNSLLDSTTDQLEDTLSGANITVLDVNTLFDDVIANPEEFGLTNVTDPFLDPLTFTPTLGANPKSGKFTTRKSRAPES